MQIRSLCARSANCPLKKAGPSWAWQGTATSWVLGWGSYPRDHCVLVHL